MKLRVPIVNRVRFGAFEVDLETGELRKSGTRVKAQAQPMKVLSLLLMRAGHIVPREYLRRRTIGCRHSANQVAPERRPLSSKQHESGEQHD